jgi:uncharacterized protein YqgC (DUF456 family)
VQTILYLILITALVCLTTFQTNRSIYVRSLGLFLILAAALIYEFQFSSPPNIILIVAMSVLLVCGFATDYYSASLRTWYFRVSDQSIWGLIIGGFVGILFSGLFPSLLPFILGSLIGAFVGEVREKGFRSVPRVTKVTLGTFAGVFGMSAKLLLGMEMVYWFLLYK